MDNPTPGTPKQELAAKLKAANNILVTVSNNPSVDQLAACIGLTLWLNKLGKHATAVFSGEVPSTVEFLEPAATLEKNTDSLRDFIIALDKSKADKLRYKVEDKVVKIFITPYRTSLTADDLEFSQGDFNVDVVVAIGVHEPNDLDAAITAHGRILHDAVVTTINTTPDGGLGSINWHDTQTSSLCELVVDLGNELDKQQLDSQIATALLTGIVAETARFSNEKTTPQTMSISAELMTAGANQQLVATKLEGAVEVPMTTGSDAQDRATEDEPAKSQDGTLEIEHQGSAEESNLELPTPVDDEEVPEMPVEESADPEAADEPLSPPSETKNSRLITEPPTLGGQLTANTEPEGYDPSVDPLSQGALNHHAILEHKDEDKPELTDAAPVLQPAPADWTPPAPVTEVTDEEPTPSVEQVANPAPEPAPAPPAEPEVPAQHEVIPIEPRAASGPLAESTTEPVVPEQPTTTEPETLADIEASVASPHAASADLDNARDEVAKALGDTAPTPEPIQALNAQPMADSLNPPVSSEPVPSPAAETEVRSTQFDPTAFGVMNDPDAAAPAAQPLNIPGVTDVPPPTQPVDDGSPKPPPVPPPMFPPA